MIGIISWEVFSRSALSAPTIWVYDATHMLYGAHFMLGCAYPLLYGGHIRTDMVWEKFSVRRKGLIDAIAYVAFFFPAMIFFIVSVTTPGMPGSSASSASRRRGGPFCGRSRPSFRDAGRL
jgi:TRAP-type mannitol/chloroaromatic compound transport system permease small subunit